MSSSPAESPTAQALDPLPVDTALRALTRVYDEALAAAASDDLDGCARLLTVADALLALPPLPATDGAIVPSLRSDARAAHARLQALLTELRTEAGDELARTRHGRKALAGYAGERHLGDRVETKA